MVIIPILIVAFLIVWTKFVISFWCWNENQFYLIGSQSFYLYFEKLYPLRLACSLIGVFEMIESYLQNINDNRREVIRTIRYRLFHIFEKRSDFCVCLCCYSLVFLRVFLHKSIWTFNHELACSDFVKCKTITRQVNKIERSVFFFSWIVRCWFSVMSLGRARLKRFKCKMPNKVY